jgi:hypothetical protein
MLYMVIERIRNGDIESVGRRFAEKGRMLPDGLNYVASWIDPAGARCFQLVQTSDRSLLDEWVRRWEDLVDFEFVSVIASAEYWGRSEITS